MSRNEFVGKSTKIEQVYSSASPTRSHSFQCAAILSFSSSIPEDPRDFCSGRKATSVDDPLSTHTVGLIIKLCVVEMWWYLFGHRALSPFKRVVY